MQATAESKVELPNAVLAQIPQTPLCTTALSLARDALPLPIFNHCVRVYLHAKRLGEVEQKNSNSELRLDSADNLALLFVACICHDLGASALYNGRQRFEVEGADAACSHMTSHGWSDREAQRKVWTAIALHTSSGIAERIDPFTRLVRVAVKLDFAPALRPKFPGSQDYATEIEAEGTLPRLGVEKALADAVVAQADAKLLNESESLRAEDGTLKWVDSEKHPKASWPGILLRAHLENPGWEGVNRAF